MHLDKLEIGVTLYCDDGFSEMCHFNAGVSRIICSQIGELK